MHMGRKPPATHRLVERPDHDNPELRRSELQLSAELDGIPIAGRVDSYKLRFLDYGVLKGWKSIGDNCSEKPNVRKQN